MIVPFYSSTREYNTYKTIFDTAIQAVMSQGDFILGSEVTKFEEEAAAYLGVKHAIGVASGSDALILGADILGFKDGSEVLTPTFTFFASASCIARLGGKPIFVDVDETTLNMDLKQASSRITNKTTGIIPVHLFLQPTSMQKVVDLANRNNLKILEDAAEAWGMESLINGSWKKAGTIGNIGTYSFFPTKTLGACGDAGLMVTNDDDLAQAIRSYRVHGSRVKYLHDFVGYNSRLDTIQAAILRLKLQRTNESITARNRHAQHYTERLSNISGIRLQTTQSDARPVYYVYNIFTQNRDKLATWLKTKGISTSIYYPRPLHLQPCFEYLGYKKGDFPISEKICNEILALPIFPELFDDEVDYVCDQISSWASGARGSKT